MSTTTPVVVNLAGSTLKPLFAGRLLGFPGCIR